MANAPLTAALPQPTTPLVDPQTGYPAPAWWYWFQRIQARTGGSTGGSYGAPVTVNLGDSPYVYTATGNGSVVISGGGVSRLRYAQAGSVWQTVGNFYVPFPVSVGTMLEFTYLRRPQVVFLPGA